MRRIVINNLEECPEEDEERLTRRLTELSRVERRQRIATAILAGLPYVESIEVTRWYVPVALRRADDLIAALDAPPTP